MILSKTMSPLHHHQQHAPSAAARHHHLQSHQLEQPTTVEKSPSNIVNFYHNRSILITGASGFVGKVLIEKLLRDCPGVRNIFVLIRPKRKMQPHERLQKLLDEHLFDQVRERPGLLEKVVVVEGDVTLANLGLSDENLLRIIGEVSVICHSAATVKFDEPLKQSIAINMLGTRNMIELCRRLPKLAAMVHVSTAYANCDREEVGEHVYPVDMDPERLIELASWMEQDTLQELKQRLLGKRPNTYTYTKALTEWMLIKCARDLPIVICRPSIVGASWREPFAGWVDNMNGPTGIILGTGKGLMRTMFGNPDCVADLVPVDTVINMIVALGWFASVYRNHRMYEDDDDNNNSNNNNNSNMMNNNIHNNNNNNIHNNNNNNNNNNSNNNNNNLDYIYINHMDDGYVSANPTPSVSISSDDEIDEQKKAGFDGKLKDFRSNLKAILIKGDLSEELADIPVFHCTTGPYNPIKWARVQVLILAMLAAFPSISTYRYPSGSFVNSKRLDYIYRLLLHYLPAYLVDLIQKLRGQKSSLVRIYEKIDQAADVLSTFTTNEWNFHNYNSKIFMNELMSAEDRRIFNCDLTTLNWPDYLRDYILGARKFMLKEPISNITEARRNLKFVYYRNMGLQVLAVMLGLFCILKGSSQLS